MLPTLTGETGKQKRHKYLYWEFYERTFRQAVILENWKHNLILANCNNSHKGLKQDTKCIVHCKTTPLQTFAVHNAITQSKLTFSNLLFFLRVLLDNDLLHQLIV